MKHLYFFNTPKNTRLFLCLAIMFSCLHSRATQLNGVYTINPSAAATTTNFKDFASAITYMTATTARADGGPANTGTVGVSGPVTFQVSAATYSITAAIVVPAITGSSAVNTVTFDGGAGNAATRIITASLSAQSVIRMNLCKYVTFRNLTINNNYSGACSGISIVGSASNNSGTGCKVKNCIVNLPNTGTGTGYCINVTATTNGHGLTACRVDSAQIDSNTATGGTHGITVYASTTISTAYLRDIKIRNNTLNNNYTYGIYCYYIANPLDVLYNTITMSTANTGTTYGIAFERCDNSAGTASHQVIGNKVRNAGYYGISLNNCNSNATYPTKVYNNMVGGGFRATTSYGYYMVSSSSYTYHMQFYHNTAYMDYPSPNGCYGLRYGNNTSGTIQVKNNIFATVGAGANAYPAYFATNPTGNVINYNIYYSSDGVNLLYRGGDRTAVTYRTTTTGGDSSYNFKPLFVNPGSNLHLANGCNGKGVFLSAVSTDIDGDARSNPPQAGADEFVPVNDNLMAEDITSPVAPITLGSQSITMRVRNVGSTSIASFTAGYILNGGAPVTQVWGGLLAPCDTVSVTFSVPATLVNSNTISAFTSDPNFNADADKTNDTVKVTLVRPLNGNYTIGGTSPDFATVAAAADALKGGVTGPVTFTVAAGTYTGQVVINGPIPGGSYANPIVFDGVDSSNRIITASVASSAVVLLKNASYVNFRNFKINNTNTGNSTVFAIAGTSTGSGIQRCVLSTSSPSSTTYGILVTGSVAGYGGYNNYTDSVHIDSNTINKCYYGIYVQGNTTGNAAYNRDLKIRGNVLNNITNMGMYIYYVYNAIDLMYNRVIMDSTVSSGSGTYGIYMYYCQNTSGITSHRVIGNYVKNGHQSGIYLLFLNGNAGAPDKIYNNVVAGGNNYDYNFYAFYYANSTSAVGEVYHNTILVDNATGTYATYDSYGLYWEGGSNTKFKNNIIVESGQSFTGTFHLAYFYNNVTPGNINYNLYYNASGQDLVYLNGTTYNSGNYKTAAAGGDSSFNYLPPFVNLAGKDLRITSGCLTGANLSAQVPDDINGNPRNGLSVLGAYQPSSFANNLAISKLVQPVQPITLGTQDLIVRVQNAGSAPIYNFTASYTINGGSPVTQVWSGILNSCDTVSVVFTGGNQVTLGGTNNIVVYVSDPNSSPDADRTNDTIKVNFIQPLNGTYTIGGSGANFASFNAAVSALYSSGMSGPVVFQVNPGTYTEQVALTLPVTGISATNTVTFDGVNPATRILTYSSSSSSQRATFKIGISHVRVRNLGIQSGSSNYGWLVHLSANNTTDIHVKNCALTFTNSYVQTSSYLGYEFAGIVATSSSQSLWNGSSTSIRVDSIEIDSNTINYGYTGIWVDNDPYYSIAPCTNIFMRNNKVNNILSFGIMLMNAHTSKVDNNTLRMSPYNSGYGIYFNGNYYNSYPGNSFSGNRINNVYETGIYIQYGRSQANSRGRIVNNVISKFLPNTYANGISMSYCDNFDIYNNSVNFDIVSTSNNAGAFYASGGSGNNIRNNHFIVTNSSGQASPVYMEPGFASVMNYNNYFKKNVIGNFVYISGVWYNPSNFVGAGGLNARSISVDPKFSNDTTLTLANGCLNGDTIASVSVDINGTLRSSTPDIGANEVISASLDAAPLVVLQPSYPVLGGFQDVRVRLINYGINPLTSLDVNYVLNNGSPVSQFWTGTLNTCDTTSVIFSGSSQVNLSAGITNTMKVYTANPNFSSDLNTTNDTLTSLLGTPMSGTYTIGGTAPDFANFTEAVNALSVRGVSGPVVLNARNGTYNEQITIRPVAGASAANTITFQSETQTQTAVTLSYNSSSASNFVVKLDNSSYITFRLMTISSLNSSYGIVMELDGIAAHDSVDNCKLSTVSTTTTSTDMAIVYANPLVGGGHVFRNNTFQNGAYGVYFYGTSTTQLTDSNVFDGNSFNAAYYRSMYFYYTSNIRIRNNTISNTTYSSHYGIHCYYCNNAVQITGNKISQTQGGYGMYLYYNTGTSVARGTVANNTVVVGGSSTADGMRCYRGVYQRVYNNSVNMTNTATASHAAYFYYSSATYNNNEIRNNIFSNTGGGYAEFHYSNPTLYNNLWDYNLLYTTGANLIEMSTPASSFATLDAWRATAVNQDKNSITYRPAFTSTTNLVPNVADTAVWALNGRGVHLPGNTTDVNGNPRAATVQDGAPDLGAYEFSPTALPPIATPNPISPVAGASQAFTFMSDTVAKLSWNAFSPVPAYVTVRFYGGEKPAQIGTAQDFMYASASVNMPAGTYNYNMDLYYKNTWVGTNPQESDVRMIRKVPSLPWALDYTSTVDTTRNIVSTQFYLTTDPVALFTGTDVNNPLPVKLIDITATRIRKDIFVNWATASELNTDHFEVERSLDGRQFDYLGNISATGNSNITQQYQYVDPIPAGMSKGMIYYRLKVVDKNGASEYTRVAAVKLDENTVQPVVIFPNPFTTDVTVKISADAPGKANIELTDITGRKVSSQVQNVSEGQNSIAIDHVSKLKAGVYFISIEMNGKQYVEKLIKE